MLPPNGGDTGEFQEDLSNVLKCPDCQEVPPNLIEEFSSGDVVCQSCGLVVGARIIDTRSEWRTFANDDQNGDDPSRVGGVQDEFVDNEQLSTSVAFSESRNHKNLARTQNNTVEKGQKSLMSGYRAIAQMVETNNMGSNVMNAAKHIYKLVDKHKFLKGKQTELVVAGCIFIACRQNGVGRTFQEIYNITKVEKKEVGRVYKQLSSFLKKIHEQEERATTGLDTVTHYESTTTGADTLVKRFVSQLAFRTNSIKISNIATALAQQANDIPSLAGRSPLSVAAACIYMACHLVGEPRPSNPIAKTAGVSDGTVKTAYKLLYGHHQELIKKEWLDEGMKIESLPHVQATEK